MSILFGLAALATTAQAQVAVDSATNSGVLYNNNNPPSSGSWSQTVSGSNTYLLVGLAAFDGNTNPFSLLSLDYNGTPMTFLGGDLNSNGDAAALWGLANPTSGTHNINWSNSGSAFQELGGGSISFTGVDQTTPVGTFVGSGASSLSLTLGAGGMGVDSFYSNNGGAGNPPTPTGTVGQTVQVNQFIGPQGPTWAMMSTNNNGGNPGTVTFDWTQGDGHGGITLNAAAVPEPSSLGLLALGGLGLLAWRRKSRA